MGYNIIFIIFSQSKLYTNKYIKYKNKFNLLTFYIDMYIKMVYNIVEDKGEKETKTKMYVEDGNKKLMKYVKSLKPTSTLDFKQKYWEKFENLIVDMDDMYNIYVYQDPEAYVFEMAYVID